jgi:hypothetical protein
LTEEEEKTIIMAKIYVEEARKRHLTQMNGDMVIEVRNHICERGAKREEIYKDIFVEEYH